MGRPSWTGGGGSARLRASGSPHRPSPPLGHPPHRPALSENALPQPTPPQAACQCGEPPGPAPASRPEAEGRTPGAQRAPRLSPAGPPEAFSPKQGAGRPQGPRPACAPTDERAFPIPGPSGIRNRERGTGCFPREQGGPRHPSQPGFPNSQPLKNGEFGKACPPASRSGQAGSRRSQPQSAGDGEKADASHTGQAGSPGVVGQRARAAGCASSGRRCPGIPARRAFPMPSP